MENIAVRRADGRAGGIISSRSRTALTLLGFVREYLGIGLALRKLAGSRRDVIDKPVGEFSRRGIGIFEDEDEALCICRDSAP